MIGDGRGTRYKSRMSQDGNKVVFFDRDGTLIIDKVYLNDPEQIEYLPGAFEELAKLRDAGFQFVIVTNQSGVARGLVTIENLNEIHRRIGEAFAAHGITFLGYYYAPYSVESNHYMRKPNPGMLVAAGEDHRINFARSWMIGDRATDVEAGHAAGCRTVLLDGIETDETVARVKPAYVARDLSDVTRFILSADQ